MSGEYLPFPHPQTEEQAKALREILKLHLSMVNYFLGLSNPSKEESDGE